MKHLLNHILEFLGAYLPVTIIRYIAWYAFFILIIIAWLAARRRSRKRTEEEEKELIEKYFEKDEDGKYPWEKEGVDELNPKNIKKGAKPYNMDHLPQRGRWKI